ncbi:MAG: hypothetical protein FJZ00_13225, partial [Candidatus Sericytochromatia bacterium]|nr:hypothetical protein [Candidatus Tanganyikabacteria bacterium]
MKKLAVGLVVLSCLTGCSAAPWSGLLASGIDKAGTRAKTVTEPVLLTVRDRATLQRIADSDIDLQAVDADHGLARAKVTQAQKAWLAKLGIAVQADSQPVRLEGFDPRFHTYDTLVRDIKALAEAHPAICTAVDLGPTWETSKGKADRRVWALHVAKGESAS